MAPPFVKVFRPLKVVMQMVGVVEAEDGTLDEAASDQRVVLARQFSEIDFETWLAEINANMDNVAEAPPANRQARRAAARKKPAARA